MKSTKLLNTVPLLIVGLGLAVNGYSQSFLTNGLVAYYPFNGNANDASGKGDNGVVYGATLAPDRFGSANSAYYFNRDLYQAIQTTGTNIPTGTAPKSFSCWFKAETPYTDSGVMWSCGQVAPESYLQARLAYVDPSWAALVVGLYNADYHKWFTNINNGTWHQYAIVIATNSLVSAFLDGQRIDFMTSAPPGTQINLAAGPLFIGYGAGEYFNGWLDEIRIYNRALSTNEVQQLYTYESAPGPIASLIKAVKPSFSNLSPTKNYQLQLSVDMNTWTNQGSPFTATNTSIVYPQYFDVDNWNSLFFRVRSVP